MTWGKSRIIRHLITYTAVFMAGGAFSQMTSRWWLSDCQVARSLDNGPSVSTEVKTLADKLIDVDPLTAAALITVAASVEMQDQSRLAILLREYSRLALREIQQRKGMITP